MKPTLQMKKVSLNLGTGDVGGGSQERPEARSFVRADATARAGGDGAEGAVGICWPRRCLRGDPTQSFTRSAKSSAKALPNLDDPLRRGLI